MTREVGPVAIVASTDVTKLPMAAAFAEASCPVAHQRVDVVY
jgi:hypothetical protein